MRDKATSWSFCDDIVSESPAIQAARLTAKEISAETISPGCGSLLRVITRLINAKSVVCVGSGAGVTGLYLLSGMATDGTLTTIDSDPERLQATRDAFTAAKIRSSSVRFIPGNGLSILDRLTNGAYDLVVLDDNPQSIASQCTRALQLLNPKGCLVILNALLDDQVPDPARRDESTVAIRNQIKEISEDPQFQVSLQPSGNGIMIITRANN